MLIWYLAIAAFYDRVLITDAALSGRRFLFRELHVPWPISSTSG